MVTAWAHGFELRLWVSPSSDLSTNKQYLVLILENVQCECECEWFFVSTCDTAAVMDAAAAGDSS